MAEIRGVFIKYIQRNEKTGECSFYVRSDNKPLLCRGISQDYPKGMPLLLTGTETKEDARKVFLFDSVHICSEDKNDTYAFISGGFFNKVGPALARAVMNSIGDVFKAVRGGTPEDLSELVKINKDVVYRMFLILKSYTDFEDVYDYIRGIGCGFFTAQLLFSKFGIQAKEKVNNNPYILTYAGMDFSECEKIAKRSGMSMCDKKRTFSLVENALILNRNSGNTRIEFEKLCGLVKKMEDKAGCYSTPRLFIAEALVQKKYELEESGDKLFIYTKEDYDNEQCIAGSIKRLKRTARHLVSTVSVEDIEKELDISYSEEQKEAFNAIASSGIKIITGGPGTGKTTLLEGILYKYEKENKNKEIVLCAPTSCAARRMQEHTKREASTIHKLLGIRPFEKDEDRKPFTCELTADCVIVDEGSMVDNEIMAMLLKAVKNTALVIVLGDVDQLPSVSAGNVFSDLIESGEIETYRLSHIFRQGPKSLIIDNSKKVINGEASIATGKNFVVQRFDTEDELVNKAVSIYKSCEDKGITDVKFYTPSRNRKFKSGATAMNLLLKKHPKTDEELTFGYCSYCIGDKVIFSKNNYEKGYFNGQEGVITSIQKMYNEIYVNVQTEDGTVYLTRAELADLDLAYAITAHKSQGGECKNAVILVPKKPASMLKRQLLYVEITRAKENVVILSEDNALEEAISSKYEFERNTGLIEKLKSA